MRFDDICNWYTSNGYDLYSTLDSGNAKVFRSRSSPDYMVLVAYAGWSIYQTSGRVGYGTNYVAQGKYQNGATGQQKGSDGYYYNYLNVFDLYGTRLFKPKEFVSVNVAYVHFESSGGYHSGTLHGRTINNIGTKDGMNKIWVEDNVAVTTDANSQYRIKCTEFVKRRYNNESCYFTLDLFDCSSTDTGRAQIYLKPFKTNGVYDTGREAARPCIEIGLNFKFNDPPTAAFDMADSCFVGNSVTVTGKSTDPNKDSLTATWSISPATYTGSLSGTSGGTIKFTSSGTYTVKLSVDDGKGGTNSISKTIKANDKGTPRLAIDVSTDVKTAHFGSTKDIVFSVSGSVSSYANSGKVIDKATISVVEAQHNYPGYGSITAQHSWSNDYYGEITSKTVKPSITTTFSASSYNQYYLATFTVHYSDTDTSDSISKLIYFPVTNGAPNDPSISYPIDKSTYHGTKPIFLATVNTDSDGDNVKCLADIYNTSTSPWTLVTRIDGVSSNTQYVYPNGWYSEKKKVKIAPSTNLNGCSSTLYVAEADSYDAKSTNTPQTNITIASKEYLQYAICRDELTVDVVNAIIDKVNDNCTAYGVSTMSKLKSSDELNANILFSIIEYMNTYINQINNWSDGNANTNLSNVSIQIDACSDSMLDILNSIIDKLYQ